MPRLHLAGHPLHPALAHFPVSLWTMAVGADAAAWLGAPGAWTAIAYWCMAVGVAAGLLALPAGLLEYARIPGEHAAQPTAIAHMSCMSTAWVLFVLSLVLRQADGAVPSPLGTGLAAGALVVMLVGGWLGGRLVYRFGIGVRGGARQASHEPASAVTEEP